MKKIILSIVLCFTIITGGLSGSAYAYTVSPQTPFIGDVQSMNRTFLTDIKGIAKSSMPLIDASIVYAENSTYLFIVVDLSATTETSLFYTLPAMFAGYYPGKLDYVYTDIRTNGNTVMTIQVDGDTSAKYAANIIDENSVIKKAVVQNYSNPVTQSSVSSVTQTTTITSKINGNFRGFKNGTTFKLLNGQIWEQSGYEYEYTYKYMPEVTIYKDGSIYYMIVDGMDTKIQVKKIK